MSLIESAVAWIAYAVQAHVHALVFLIFAWTWGWLTLRQGRK